jgi:YD repeat-containing protein
MSFSGAGESRSILLVSYPTSDTLATSLPINPKRTEARPATANAVVTSGGTYTTSYAYWYENLINTITKPDSTVLTTTRDGALRIVGGDDGTNSYAYSLDLLGDRTQTQFLDSDGDTTRSSTATYDALGRMLTKVGGTNSQTTTYTYDHNGNVLTVSDPLSHVTTFTYDALNRRITSTPPINPATTFTFNAWDKVTAIQNGQGDTTTYVYDGFGDLLSKKGPRSGQVATLYAYDKNGNLTQKKDARLVIANYTYDVLDRQLTIVYPASTTENVTNTYDQTGHGFGIGHLTSATDAAGTLTRSYDERGNITIDSRIVTGVTLTTTNTYDSVGHLASVTYPSGAKQSFTYNADDQISGLAFLKGAISKTGTITHEPFGGITNLTNYNATPVDNFTYDLDGEMITATAMNGSTNFMNWSYI